VGNFTSGYEPDYEFIMMIDGKVVEEHTEVALGRWIDIVVQPTSGQYYGHGWQFYHWSAPSNLLNGERSARALHADARALPRDFDGHRS
jgi:hypothetical protein